MRVSLAMTATSVGGVWRHVVDLADGLRERGHDVKLGLSTQAVAPRAEAQEHEFAVCSLIESLDSRNEIWHLHLHDTYDLKAMTLMATRRALGKLVTTEHLPHFNGSDRSLLGEGGMRTKMTSPVKTAIKRSSIATCDALIVPSARVTQFMRTRYRLGDTPKLHTVPLGVAPASALMPIPDEPVGGVLASGSIILQKGFDLLLEAVGLSRTAWPLTIMGDGPHASRLSDQIDGPLGDRVVLAGWQAQPAPWVQRSRVICLPSRWETSPYVAIEAQLAARPVVAFAVDGIPEIVEDGATGILVEPGDVHGLARALDTLATDIGKASRMGLAGRKRSTALFGISEMIQRTEAIYQVLVDAHHGRARRGLV